MKTFELVPPSNIPEEDGYTILAWGLFAFKFDVNRKPVDGAYDVIVDTIPRCSAGNREIGQQCPNDAIMEIRIPTDDGVQVARTCSESHHLNLMEQVMRDQPEHLALNFRPRYYLDAQSHRYLASG